MAVLTLVALVNLVVHSVLSIDPSEDGWLAHHSGLSNWIASVGQAVGAIGTFLAIVVALRAEGKAEARRMKDIRDREEARARLVSVRMKDNTGLWKAVVFRNDSENVIFNLRLVGIWDIDATEQLDFWYIPPNARALEGPPNYHGAVDVVASRSEGQFLVARSDDSLNDIPFPSDEFEFPCNEMQVIIAFDDHEGLTWIRSNNGTVEKVTRGSDTWDFFELGS